MALLTVDVNAHLDRATTSLSFLESTAKTTIGLDPVGSVILAASDVNKYHSLRASTEIAYQTGMISHEQAWEYNARLDIMGVESNYSVGSAAFDVASEVVSSKVRAIDSTAKHLNNFFKLTNNKTDFIVGTISSLNSIYNKTEGNNPYNLPKYYNSRGGK